MCPNCFGWPCICGPLTLPERFWRRVEKGEGCWEWTGRVDRHGYGKGIDSGTSTLAHRVSWEMHNGPIPAGMCVCHRCDNRRCVHPDHLFLGTNADNIRDRDAKGRGATGERQGLAKLTAAKVVEIRHRYAAGESQASLARVFGVAQSNIGAVVTGRTWKH